MALYGGELHERRQDKDQRAKGHGIRYCGEAVRKPMWKDALLSASHAKAQQHFRRGAKDSRSQ